MDLSRFDTREKASAGVDVELVIDDEVIYGDDGKPVTFRIKGIADQEVYAAINSGTKSRDRTLEEVKQSDLKIARAAVVGWSDNFTVNGEKLPYSRENIAKVFETAAIRRAVLLKVMDEQRFMNGS